MMNDDIAKIYFTEEQLKAKVAELGAQITEDYKDAKEDIYCVGILKGASVFYTDLVRNINLPVHFDFMIASSYGNGTESSGSVKILKDLDYDVEGKHLIIIEDIIDTGITMHYLKQFIKDHYKPKNLYVCVLVKRNNLNLKYSEIADFTGLTTDEQRYIVGFGFDYYGLWRNEPYVFVPSQKDIQEWNRILEEDAKIHSDLTKR